MGGAYRKEEPRPSNWADGMMAGGTASSDGRRCVLCAPLKPQEASRDARGAPGQSGAVEMSRRFQVGALGYWALRRAFPGPKSGPKSGTARRPQAPSQWTGEMSDCGPLRSSQAV